MGTLRRLFSPPPFLLAIVMCAAAVVTPAAAQQGRLAANTDARSAPRGTVVAQLTAGTSWKTGPTRAGFTSVTIEAWVDASRFGPKRDSFPATIGGSGTLRIREEPSLSGRILGSFRAGAGITILQRRGTWARIRREVWVPSTALAAQPAAQTAQPAATLPATPAPQPARQEPVSFPPVSATLRAVGNLPLRAGPDGNILALVDSGAVMSLQARDKGWAKVRIEGWVPDSALVPADSSFGAVLSAADLRADPEGHRGKLLRWRVQVVGLQSADPLRRDMRPNEPFLLVIGPAGEDATVYVTVPPDLLGQARLLPPMSTVMLTARVRTGRSNPTGAPILELVSISEARGLP
jgi:uncharacterized protein YgiM (DUF1202 family)